VSQSEERLEEINDALTLLANMVVEGNRVQAVLRTYLSWNGTSALLHEHLLVDGVEATRERPVPIALVTQLYKKHWITNRQKGRVLSVTEFVLSEMGSSHLVNSRTQK
jgi:hypothetical protein